nr:hypothetical protein [uncultured Rhodopila sp.]
MIRSIAPRRLPALMLAMLAVWALLLRVQTIPAQGDVVALYGTLCHTGDPVPRDPGRPPTDCDTCLLCHTVQDDHGGTVLLPSAVPIAEPGFAPSRLAPIAAETGFGRLRDVPRARDPPATA